MTPPLEANADDLRIDRYRSYLLLLARIQLDGRAAAKVDASDIVQQTLLEAHAKQNQFTGDDDALAAWLRRALVNNLRDTMRALRRGKRDIRREASLDAQIDQSSLRLGGLIPAHQSSPSQQAVRSEALLRLATALEQLPEPQREAIVLHHLHGWPVVEVAAHLSKSDASVAGLLFRGLRKLRELMPPE